MVAPGLSAAPLQSPGSVPWRLLGAGLKVPAQAPLQRARPGLFVIPGRRARLGPLLVGQPLPSHPPTCRAGRRGGGGVGIPPSLGGSVRGPWGAGGGASLCLGPFHCLPRLGTKAGFIGVAQCMEGVVSLLLSFVLACCRPDAVRGVPLRAGTGLQACPSHCGSARVSVWGRAAYWPSGAPPRVLKPFQGRGGGLPGPAGGGYRADVPLAGRRPFVGRRGEREERGGGRAGAPHRPPLVPWCLPPVAAGSLLEGLGPDPPRGRWRSAARPSLLHGGSGELAAGGSTPAVSCAVWVVGGGGDGEWAPVPGVGARQGGTPGRWPALPPAPLAATGRQTVV